MVNYQEVRVRPINTQLSKLKSATKNKAGIIVKVNKKKFQDKELQLEIRNAIAKNCRRI